MAIEQPRQLPLSLCSSDEGEAPFNLGFAGLFTAGISNSRRSAGWTPRRLAVLQSLMEEVAQETVLNGLNVKLFINKASSSLFPESSIAAMLMGLDYDKRGQLSISGHSSHAYFALQPPSICRPAPLFRRVNQYLTDFDGILAATALREFLEDIAQEPYFEKKTEDVSRFEYPEKITQDPDKMTFERRELSHNTSLSGTFSLQYAMRLSLASPMDELPILTMTHQLSPLSLNAKIEQLVIYLIRHYVPFPSQPIRSINTELFHVALHGTKLQIFSCFFTPLNTLSNDSSGLSVPSVNTPFKVPEVRKGNSVLQIIATDEYDLAIHDEFFKAVLAVRALFHHLLQYGNPPIFFICPPSSRNGLAETEDYSLDHEMMFDSDGETCVEYSDSDYEMMEETGYDTDLEMYGEPYSDNDYEMHDELYYNDEDVAHY